jgi:hypothetical protein
MSSKEQIQNTLNPLGNKMKGYTIVAYVNGKPERGSSNWVTLQALLGMTDFSDAEVDALADLQVGGAPLLLDFNPENKNASYTMITRVH